MRTKPARRVTRRPHDPLFDSTKAATFIACEYTAAPYYRAEADMEEKWGIGRLPGLVSVETAARFGSAAAKLQEAINFGDTAGAELRANVCIRGLSVMDREAEAAGHKKTSVELWELEIEGKLYGIVKSDEDWFRAMTDRPDLTGKTLREALIALHGICSTEIFAEVDKHFPKAKIKGFRTKEILEDDIPF